MRKTHNTKHKLDIDYSSDEELRRSASKSESSSHRHRKRHKKCKHRDYVDDENIRNDDMSSVHNGRQVIEIHDSSSENDCENNSSQYDNIESKKIESNKYKHQKREERKHKKRRRSRSQSQTYSRDRDVDYTKSRAPKSKMEERRCKRKGSESDSDYQSSNDFTKKRELSSNESNETNHKMLEDIRNNRDVVKGKGKSKAVYEGVPVDKIKKEPSEKRSKRQSVSDGERTRRNNNQEPSGSRGNSRRRGSRERAEHEWGTDSGNKSKQNKPQEVQKPNFGLSGKLTEDTNTYNGVVIKYSEPPEARMPKKRWRLYPFKGDQALPPLYIHRQSAYLLGRDRKVVDMPIDHPSCSKQHAALQYRLVTYERADGSTGKQIRLYIIDLESANGTFINNKKIEPRKYVELFEKDVIKFGYSSREYVLLHEHSKDDNPDDT